jgi:hypothetical protein
MIYILTKWMVSTRLVPSHDVPTSDQFRLGMVSVKALMHKFVF